MRKPSFCICEHKDADQLRGNREADQWLYKIQDTRNFISCRLRLTNNISSELFSDKQSKNETNVKRLQ